MGAVRVKVKLTNTTDEELVLRGQLRPEQVRSYEADALVDTGGVMTIIPVHVFEQLGLHAHGQHVACYADGRRESVDLTGPITIRIYDRKAIDDSLVLGEEVLIGQTVLAKMDLHVDCRGQKLIPNPAHPDQPVVRV